MIIIIWDQWHATENEEEEEILHKFILLALQPCTDLGLLGRFREFRNSRFLGLELLIPRRVPNQEDQELYFVWALQFNLSGMCGYNRSWCSRQHGSSR
jgi:hypothetical protein